MKKGFGKIALLGLGALAINELTKTDSTATKTKSLGFVGLENEADLKAVIKDTVLQDTQLQGILKGGTGGTGATGATGATGTTVLPTGLIYANDRLKVTQQNSANSPVNEMALTNGKSWLDVITPTGSERSLLYFDGTNAVTLMQIISDGTIKKIGGGSFSAISDERLKDNINAFEKGLEKILAIETKTFQYKKVEGTQTEFYPNFICEKTQYGVIAQQLREVCPEMVSEDEEGFLSVDLSNIPLMLVNAVKELNAKDLDQQKQITALKTENAKLKTSLASIEERLTALETPQPQA